MGAAEGPSPTDPPSTNTTGPISAVGGNGATMTSSVAHALPAAALPGTAISNAAVLIPSTVPLSSPPPQGSSITTEPALPQIMRVEFLYTSTPVEGCDLLPYVIIRTPSGEAKSAESIEAKTRGALSVQYRWNRCAATYTCACKGCVKPATQQFVPLLKIAARYHISPEQLEAVTDQSFFCSTPCFLDSWPALRLYVHNLTASLPRVDDPEVSPDDLVDAVQSHCVIGRSDGIFQDPLVNPTKVTEVAFIRNYAPTTDDVGHVLELVCRYVQRSADGSVNIGPPLSIRSLTVRRIPDPPPERSLFNLSTGELFSASTRRPGTFRVLTYNILSEIYANTQSYPQCPSWALAWTYRKRNLIREMSHFDADILCLQEVQADHYEDHFQPYFQRKGYEGCFKGKTREAMGRRGKIDGCATLYRTDMFSLREQFVVEFNTIAQSRTKEPRILNRALKGNVGLILILDTFDGSGPVVVANTHLYWDPEYTDVKLFQMDAFMQELELLIQTRQLGSDVPIVLAGDFNSEPVSSVYELVSTGSCSLSKNDVPQDSPLLASCRLHHNLHLRSSYSLMGSEPAFTNYTHSFVAVLDYIWYGGDSVLPTAVLEIPSENHLFGKNSDSTDGIPNEQWSSDHILLLAEFQILKRASLGHSTM